MVELVTVINHMKWLNQSHQGWSINAHENPVHYALNHYGYILPVTDTQGSAQSIIKTYDKYLFRQKRTSKNKKILPPLLDKFCQLTPTPTPTHADRSTSELYRMNHHHLGQMSAAYPLSPSQRLSLNYFNDPGSDNLLFTVHGPPGTGKTTLLTSVIASLWIERALKCYVLYYLRLN